MVYTVARTAGSVTVNLGGVAGTTRSTAATFTDTITAVTTGNLFFTPTTTFVGSIDTVSVTPAARIGAYYYVTYTVAFPAGAPAGSVTASIGGVSGTARTKAGTFTDIMAVTTTVAGLAFTPTTDFTGSIDNVYIETQAIVNTVVDSTTLEMNAISLSTETAQTCSACFNPVQSQFTSTVVFGDGTHGNVVPNGARILQPNIMFSQNTPADALSADSSTTSTYINFINGGVMRAQQCLFGDAYFNFSQAASVYLRDVGFAYQWALNECYDVDIDSIGNAATPTYWYYTTKWICRDQRYGLISPYPIGPTAGTDVSMTYIHNASIKNWHKVIYCSRALSGTSSLYPVQLSLTDDATWENIRITILDERRQQWGLYVSSRVYRNTFTNLQLYGSNGLYLGTSDDNVFNNIEYSPGMFNHIYNFKTGMRISEDPSLTLIPDNTTQYFKTRSFYSWLDRTAFFESAEYSSTPFQANWQFPDRLSARPTESVPASVTFDWTQREPTATTLGYEIHRSLTENFTTRDNSTAVMRNPTATIVTWANGPRQVLTSAATRVFTYAAAGKTITQSGTGAVNWIADGYRVGDTIDIISALNTGTYTISVLNNLVCTVSETLVDETSVAGQLVTPRARVLTASATRIFTFAVGKTITQSGADSSNWVNDGYGVGDVIDIVSGSNTGTYTVTVVSNLVLTVSEIMLAEVANSGQTVTSRAPAAATKYYYRFRKMNASIPKIGVNAASGSATMTAGRSGAWSFDTAYALTDFYFTSGSTILRNRKQNLFATPFYIGATITGYGIPAGTTITAMDIAGREMTISQATTQAGNDITIVLPVQAGMGVIVANGKPLAGLPYGTTILSVENSNSLTLSNTMTGDLAPVVLNGTFTGNATGWTLGGGGGAPDWHYNGANGVDHNNGGGTAILTPAVALVSRVGTVYYLTYTISNYMAGTITPTLGGVGGTGRTSNGTFTDTITATTTGNLFFTPTTTFVGTIDNIFIETAVILQTFTESPQFAVTTHNYTSAANLCKYSRDLTQATWAKSNTTVAAASYQSPSDTLFTTNTACAITATAASGTVTMTVAGLTAGQVYSASVWVRADQELRYPAGVSGSVKWGSGAGLVTTTFTATNEWKKYKAENFTATATSHDVVITVDVSGLVLWATDVSVNLGATANAAAIATAATPVTLKPSALPLAALTAYARPAQITGSTGNQGIYVNLGTAPTGSYFTEIYMSSTPGFSPSNANRVATTFAYDTCPITLSGSSRNKLSNITKLPGGGSASAAATGLLYLSAASNENVFEDVDIDYSYCNTTGIPPLHIISPAQNNVFHNMDFGRVANYLASSVIYNDLAVNSVTGNRIQNINAKHHDCYFTNTALATDIKGIASGSASPAIAGSTFALGGDGVISGIGSVYTACYGSMFRELYFSDTEGALNIVFEDTQGATKPYTYTGTPVFNNAGSLFLPTVASTMTITWPHKIRGVTGFKDVMPRLLGVDFGNNANLLDGLKIEYSINGGAFKRLTGANLVAEGAMDATSGFDFSIKLTPMVFMKFSTQTTGTYTSHTIANPGVITIAGPTWKAGQECLYTTTGTAIGGLTNNTVYYITSPNGPPTTTMQLSATLGGAGLELTGANGNNITTLPVSGVHTFNVLFKVGEIIRGTTSLASAEVAEVYYDTVNAGTLILTNVTGTFVPGEVIRTDDLLAIKATNVATNGFAVGPSFTSLINMLQIATTVDKTKLYPIQRPSITLTGLQPYSEIRVFSNAMDEIAGVENIGNTTTWSAQYDYYTDVTGYIMIASLGYQVLRLENIVFGVDGVTLPVQQLLDRQYSNPA